MPVDSPTGSSTYDPTQDPGIPPQTRIQLAWGKVQSFHGPWARGAAANLSGAIAATARLRN
jgi:hypothetical protein